MNVKPTDIYGSEIAFSSENIYIPEFSMSLSEAIALRKFDIPVAWEDCIKDIRSNVYNMMTLRNAVVTLESDSGGTAHAESLLSGGTLYIKLYNINGTQINVIDSYEEVKEDVPNVPSVSLFKDELAKKQSVLKAGDNITIAEDGTISSVGGNANSVIYNTGETTVSGNTVADKLTLLINKVQYLEEKIKEITSGSTGETKVITDDTGANIAVIGDATFDETESAIVTSLGTVEGDVLIL